MTCRRWVCNLSDKKGAIPLKDVGSVRAEDYKDKKHCFKVMTSSRSYYIIATSHEEMKGWIDSLTHERKKFGETSHERMKRSGYNPPALAAKQVTVEDFETLNVIGSGGFGKVYQVRYKPTDQIMAMKVLNKKSIVEADEVVKLRTERSILTKLDSPFLVKLHFSFQNPNKIFFAMDYINGGELFFHLQQQERGFTPERVKFYAAEILLGVEYLHTKGIIYRDLKPENVLISADGHVRMTDFGISKEGLNAKDDRTATFCGTPEYLAPEVLEGKEYGKEVDWWSYGTLVYEMLVGVPPFYSEDVQVMYRKILNDPVDVKAIKERDPDPAAADLIQGLLERNVQKRLVDPEVLKKHPYFASIDWEKLNRLEITPPFVPAVKGDDDTSQIDPTFTRQKPALSIAGEDVLSKTAQQQFMNFTWVADSELSLDKD
ncbi:PHprotein kinase domain containing protein [Acanthamoeba castellanii str. Neff]|uniref:non-specific serine/threonine protein kinase n=2 Tax=Acanthamoeba castellanii (strain ATCC 30010 / Neff) TaxID=1257118 RepID=L8GIE6_ACACF|nr:PHprotein kinase domain containing protein [Acanthamoeba castellanii str. Neff]ELR11956.1 PHprotein kinase domain containing protein [Acanthamoeba castellanii str. Neff]